VEDGKNKSPVIFVLVPTVEAMAAGTFAMMDMTPLRSRSMKIWNNK
jgi:hypothetical protein